MRKACTWPAMGSLIAAVLLLGGCGDGREGHRQVEPAALGGGAAGTTAANIPSPRGSPPTSPSESLHPVVVIETSLGNIRVKLDAEKADMTVDNFLRYVDRKHYDNTIFHQVLKDYVILGGAYTPELIEKKTDSPIFNQAHNGLKNLRGTIAMARQPDVIDSARCMFFINVRDNPMLDHKGRGTPEEYGYCVFGQVIEGMEVVDRIAAVEVKDTEQFERIPVEPVVIKSIRRVQ